MAVAAILFACTVAHADVYYEGGIATVNDDGSFMLDRYRYHLGGTKLPQRVTCRVGALQFGCERLSIGVLRAVLATPQVVLYPDSRIVGDEAASGYVESGGQRHDLAEALVKAGWLLADGERYAAAAAEARNAKRGIWELQ